MARHFGRIFMAAKLSALAAVTLAVVASTIAQAAEPKHGGILKIYHRETPPSLSIHEEATFTVNVPAMPPPASVAMSAKWTAWATSTSIGVGAVPQPLATLVNAVIVVSSVFE